MAKSNPQEPWEEMPWNFMEADGWTWFDKTTFGSGVGRAIVGWVMSHSGMEETIGLRYDALAKQFEFTEKQIRAAVARLAAKGHARIVPANSHSSTYPEGSDEVLLLLTPSRLLFEQHEREVAEAKKARRAAKVAARGGRVNRAAIPTLVMARVYARDEFTCQECGATEDLTLDHIKPWSLGGPDTVENLRVLCRPCNSRKGDRL